MLAKQAATQVLSGLYQAIADHSQIDSILTAMDDFLDSDPDGLESGDADWKTMFRDHFGRVGQFLDDDPEAQRESPIVFVDKQVVPAAVIDRNYKVIAHNALFGQLRDPAPASLADIFSTPADRRRLDQLLRANGDWAPILISLTLPDTASPIFVVASRTELLDVSGQSGFFVTLKVAKATWNPDLAPLMESAYGLTPAEIEILAGLVDSGSIAAVAEARGRSIRTVRTQLTHIFGKLGLSSQTELALFLATLTQLMTKERRPSDVGADWSKGASEQITRHTIKVQDRDVAYVKYGQTGGVPVLLIHATTPPDMTPDFRQACADAGLQIIGVHKPGSGGSSPRSSKHGPNELAGDYLRVLQGENIASAIIAGHCSGGLYALQFAKSHPKQSKGVVLIDTGVPFSGRRELMALPKPLRRTFLPARYIPEVLIVPHRIFANNFQRSAEGEARVIDYFFEGCPIDQSLTRTNRIYYEITRQIIEYSFQDVDRLVADVCRWAKDWSALLNDVSVPITFCHGEENRLFEARRIRDFLSVNASADAAFSKGCGQLQVYQDASGFAEAVKLIQTKS